MFNTDTTMKMVFYLKNKPVEDTIAKYTKCSTEHREGKKGNKK